MKKGDELLIWASFVEGMGQKLCLVNIKGLGDIIVPCSEISENVTEHTEHYYEATKREADNARKAEGRGAIEGD